MQVSCIIRAHIKYTCSEPLLHCNNLFYYTGHQSIEYKLFTEYYNKLVDILPAIDLSHHFVSDKILSLTDHEKIIRCSIPQEGAKLLLDRVCLQLQSGNSTVFIMMLLIMDHHGVIASKELSQEILNKLSVVKCESDTSSSDRQGNYHEPW